MLPTHYIHLPPGRSPQALEVEPGFAAIVIIDSDVSPEWRHEVSEWLVAAGCLNMMAWGHNCSLWDDSVDIANLEAFDWKDIPEGKSIMTTWHTDESLEDVFHFSMICQEYSEALITCIIVFDITDTSREDVILTRYSKVREEVLNGYAEARKEIASARQSVAVTIADLGLIMLLLVTVPLLYYGLTR